MIKTDITPEESIKQNLTTWCFEVGSQYESYAKISAGWFLQLIDKDPVIDLGSGDGAATNVFIKNGNPTTAVDINKEKLAKIEGAMLVNEDFLTFLTKPLDGHVFLHHSLEHFVDPQSVLAGIGSRLKSGYYCFVAVPFNDQPHSVHHVAFESHEELTPPNFEQVYVWERRTTDWLEIGVISKK